jgi:hypothetical protein
MGIGKMSGRTWILKLPAMGWQEYLLNDNGTLLSLEPEMVILLEQGHIKSN